MNKITRTLCLGMVIMSALVLLLSGCGAAKTGENQTTAAVETSKADNVQAETTAEPLQPVDLIWYVIGTPQADQAAVDEAMSKITKEKINASIKTITIDWGAYNDKMKVMSAGGEVFDLCFTSSWANEYLGAVTNGALLAIDDLLAQYGKNITSQVPSKFWDAIKVKGETYAMLNYQIFVANNGLMVRKDLAEKYGFDPKAIKKLADFEPFFEKVKQGEQGITPYLNTGGAIPYFNFETGYLYDQATSSWYLPLYVNVKDPDLKVIDLGETDEYKEMAKLMRSWYQKGYIRKDAASIKDFAAERKSGKYAAYVQGTLKPGGEIEDKNAYGYDVIAVPVAPAYSNTGVVISSMTGISKTSKNPERAIMLFDLMYADKELYNLACVGIKDKHYKMVDDKLIESIADSGYAPNTDWVFGNQFNALLRKGMLPTVWEDTVKLNDSAEVSPLLGFTYDKEALKNEIAQVEAIMQEYSSAIATGTIDYEKIRPELKDKLEKAGLSRIQEDVQKQINDWKAAKGKK